ncbi:MAG: 1-acyl-sn-glycerol-3-phosphate acyltransferase [Flavobacteriales bacterium]
MAGKSVLYATLKPFVNWACRLFYRNLHVRNAAQLNETQAPVLLISNHQNALMDPLLCCITSPKQLNFLTRADVFKKPWAKKILFSLNMLPVYRPHDKVNILESNAPTFKESLRRLENNQVISLFPEGTHQPDQNLKPFKKGAARLVGDLFDSGSHSKFIIQPVGLHFTNIMHSGYPGFAHFGEQVEVHASELDLVQENRSKMVLALTTRLQQILQKYVVHIDEDELYTKKLFVFRALQWSNLFSKRKSNLLEFKALELELDQHLTKLDGFSDEELEQVEKSSFDTPALVLAANKQLRKKFGRKLLALIPIYIIGMLSVAIPYFIGRALSAKMVKDVCFTSTAKIVLGAVLTPLWWIGLFMILLPFMHIWGAALSLVILIFCGAIFLKYHTSYRILLRARSLRTSADQRMKNAVKQILNLA